MHHLRAYERGVGVKRVVWRWGQAGRVALGSSGSCGVPAALVPVLVPPISRRCVLLSAFLLSQLVSCERPRWITGSCRKVETTGEKIMLLILPCRFIDFWGREMTIDSSQSSRRRSSFDRADLVIFELWYVASVWILDRISKIQA